MVAVMEQSRVAHRGGSELDSIEQTLEAYTDHLLRVACSILRDPVEAEDAVQDALVLAWRKWDQVRDPEQRRSWLTSICVRQCIRLRLPLLRRRGEKADAALSETPAAEAENWSDWDAAMAKLSPKQRAVIVLHYRYRYTLDECAELMGCGPGSTRQHLSRALAHLRKEISDA